MVVMSFHDARLRQSSDEQTSSAPMCLTHPQAAWREPPTEEPMFCNLDGHRWQSMRAPQCVGSKPTIRMLSLTSARSRLRVDTICRLRKKNDPAIALA